MTDCNISQAADMLLDFLTLIRNDLFLENDFMKSFPLVPKDVQKNVSPMTIPPSHIKVLLYLEKTKSSPISQIANSLSISKSNMTPIIDKLIECDLVNRYSDPSDRRVLRIELTPKGMDIFETIKSIAKEAISNKISCLSDNDLSLLNDSLSTLSNIMHKINE